MPRKKSGSNQPSKRRNPRKRKTSKGKQYKRKITKIKSDKDLGRAWGQLIKEIASKKFSKKEKRQNATKWILRTVKFGDYKKWNTLKSELFKAGLIEAGRFFEDILKAGECLHDIKGTKKKDFARERLERIQERIQNEKDSGKRTLLNIVLERAEKEFLKIE